MTLKDTIPLMLSDDWRDRLVAEYWQTKIRYEKLYDNLWGAVDRREKICDQIKEQYWAMDAYLSALRKRAKNKRITLGDEEEWTE